MCLCLGEGLDHPLLARVVEAFSGSVPGVACRNKLLQEGGRAVAIFTKRCLEAAKDV